MQHLRAPTTHLLTRLAGNGNGNGSGNKNNSVLSNLINVSPLALPWLTHSPPRAPRSCKAADCPIGLAFDRYPTALLRLRYADRLLSFIRSSRRLRSTYARMTGALGRRTCGEDARGGVWQRWGRGIHTAGIRLELIPGNVRIRAMHAAPPSSSCSAQCCVPQASRTGVPERRNPPERANSRASYPQLDEVRTAQHRRQCSVKMNRSSEE